MIIRYMQLFVCTIMVATHYMTLKYVDLTRTDPMEKIRPLQHNDQMPMYVLKVSKVHLLLLSIVS